MKRVSRPDCVSNRNTLIMGNFAKAKVGSTAGLFDGLEFPKEVSGREFKTSEEYYMWEHGWHTLEQYVTAYHRLRNLFGANTYSECGATVARFQSWGILEDTKYIIGGVSGALEKLPELNENFNDTKDFILVEPTITRGNRVKCTYIVRTHDDIDPHQDYPSDPHILGILRQIPVVFGLAPAHVKQTLVPYDLEKLCNIEPEFRDLDLDPRTEGDTLIIRDPITQSKRALAHRVQLLPDCIPLDDERLCREQVFLGEYREANGPQYLLDGALATKDTVLFPDRTILKAPYFVINYESEREGGTLRSFFYGMLFKLQKEKATRDSLLKAISQIAHENKDKVAALSELRTYKNELEHMVEERTSQLKQSNESLKIAYNDLQATQAELIQQGSLASAGRLAIGVAHNIRNPIESVRRNLEALKPKALDLLKLYVKETTGNILSVEEQDTIANYIDTKFFSGNIVLLDTVQTTQRIGRLEQILDGSGVQLKRREVKRLAEFNISDSDMDVLCPLFQKYGSNPLYPLLENGYRFGVYITTSLESIQAANDIINATMSYAGIREKKGDTNLNSNIENVLTLLSGEIRKNQIHVKKEYDPTLPTIQVSPAMLNQVYENLFSNAIYAMKDVDRERELTVRTYQRDHQIYFEVQDNGVGIPEEIRDKVYQPFFTTKPQGEGTGMGLWTVYNILRKYGGISIDSTPGRTTVTVNIDPLLLKEENI
jgi:signal transduction histidine kinase